MMHFQYGLKTSDRHGIGLFSEQDIKQGTVLYTASPLLDLNLTPEQYESLNHAEQAEVQWWGFFDEPSQMWHVDFDVTKFINHAYNATATQHPDHDEAYLVAARDIKTGEEITQNYLEFESQADLARRGIPPAA